MPVLKDLKSSLGRHIPGWLIALQLFAVCAGTAIARAADGSLAKQEEDSLRAAVARVSPGVVRIETVGGLEKVEGLLVGVGPTTGLIVSSDGYIVSSSFNFVQQPSSILVTLPDGSRAAAQVVARDHSRMLVLLKVETNAELPTPVAVPWEEMRVGQWAVAVGRTFDPQRPNVSVGILSARGRMHGRAIQTDAKISPSNYGGPLIDIRGRVLGVLAPMSPQETTDVAGFEWYDSGIGFAIPLVDILSRLDHWKAGKDLRRGLMGVGMKAGDPYTLPATTASAPRKSPARLAGFAPGDTIVEVDGQAIESQMQLQLQLGPRYAGDKVRVVAKRGNEIVEGEVLLVDKLPAYQDPFLGVLPRRGQDEPAEGIVVRYVYPESPAAQAGLRIGDRIIQLGDVKFKEVNLPPRAAAPLALSAYSPGDKIKVVALRGKQSMELELEAARMPTTIPGDLPPASEPLDSETDAEVAAAEASYDDEENSDPGNPNTAKLGKSELQLPEFKNICRIYVPENQRPDEPLGVLLWLHASGGDDPDRLFSRWMEYCKTNGLILLAPQASDPLKWSPTDSEFVMKCLETVSRRYTIDKRRVVAHGYQAGGAMAYHLAIAHRDAFTGVAVIDAPLPGSGQIADNEPGQRLAVLAGVAKNARFAERIATSLATLQAAEYPVTVVELGDESRYLTAEELAELVRWIDALDRF